MVKLLLSANNARGGNLYIIVKRVVIIYEELKELEVSEGGIS